MGYNKKTKLAMLLLFGFLILLWLWKSYDVGNFIIGIVGIILFVAKTMSKNTKKNLNGIMEEWGSYVGILVLIFLTSGIWKVIKNSESIYIPGDLLGVYIAYLICGLILIGCFDKDEKKAHLLIKYTGLYIMVICMFVYNIKYAYVNYNHMYQLESYSHFFKVERLNLWAEGMGNIYYAAIVFIGVFAIIEMVQRHLGKMVRVNTFRWCFWLTVIFMYETYISPGHAAKCIQIISGQNKVMDWGMDIIAVITIAFVVAYAYVSYNERLRIGSYDTRIILVTYMHILVLPIAFKNYSKYVYILYLALFLVDIAFLFFEKTTIKEKGLSVKSIVISYNNIYYVIFSMVAFGTYYLLLRGIADVILLIVFGIVAMIHFVVRDKERGLFTRAGIAIVGIETLLATDLCWHFYSSKKFYMYILALMILFMLSVSVMHFSKSKYAKWYGIGIVMIAGILLLSNGRSNGIALKLYVENNVETRVTDETMEAENYIQIVANPRNRSGKIEKIYYFWNTKNNGVKNIEIDNQGKGRIKKESGVLTICARDNHGVTSRCIRVIN